MSSRPFRDYSYSNVYDGSNYLTTSTTISSYKGII